jgi:hypothetical protein
MTVTFQLPPVAYHGERSEAIPRPVFCYTRRSQAIPSMVCHGERSEAISQLAGDCFALLAVTHEGEFLSIAVVLLAGANLHPTAAACTEFLYLSPCSL